MTCPTLSKSAALQVFKSKYAEIVFESEEYFRRCAVAVDLGQLTLKQCADAHEERCCVHF
jgi:hypothetical protein